MNDPLIDTRRVPAASGAVGNNETSIFSGAAALSGAFAVICKFSVLSGKGVTKITEPRSCASAWSA